MSYLPNMNLVMVADSTKLGVTLEVLNMQFDAVIFGEILSVDDLKQAVITATPVVLKANLTVSNVGGALVVSASQAKVTLNNFHFTRSGFGGTAAQLQKIQPATKSFLESTLTKDLAMALEDAFESAFGAYSVSESLLPSAGPDTNVTISFSSAQHVLGGLDFGFDSTATTLSEPPAAPVVPSFRGSPSGPPVFGPQTPSGAGYDSAVPCAEDFISQVLAACMGSGLLETSVPAVFPRGTWASRPGPSPSWTPGPASTPSIPPRRSSCGPTGRSRRACS